MITDGPIIASTDGVTLATYRHGAGDEAGTPWLGAHATGFCGPMFDPIAAALGRPVITFDFRGHGRSSAPADGVFVWERFADDVLALIDALSLTGTVAFGHSMGGAALLMAELARPGTFQALYLFEPVVMPLDPTRTIEGNPLAQAARRRRDRFDSPAAAFANFASKPPMQGLDRRALEAYVTYGFVVAEDGSVQLACEREHEASIYEMAPFHRTFERLGEVACPVVVAISGEAFGPALAAPAIAEALPKGGLVRYDDLTHFGPFEAPERIAADLLTLIP